MRSYKINFNVHIFIQLKEGCHRVGTQLCGWVFSSTGFPACAKKLATGYPGKAVHPIQGMTRPKLFGRENQHQEPGKESAKRNYGYGLEFAKLIMIQ